MRVSTSLFYQLNTTALQDQQTAMYKTQQQVATQRRILTPSDDASGATYVLQTSQAKAMSDTNLDNIKLASTTLEGESNVLKAISTVLDNVKTVAINSSGSSSTQNRTDFANYLTTLYEDLQGYANEKDSQGNYLFSGFAGSTKPYTQTVGNATNYAGDSGIRNMAISQTRNIRVSDSGPDVFGTAGTASDPFTAINQMITDLQNPALIGSAYDAAMSASLTNITTALNRVNTLSAQVGIRYQEMQTAELMEKNLNTQYANELTRVEGVDMQKAAITLNLQQTTLSASQQAFVKASELSLFKYM